MPGPIQSTNLDATRRALAESKSALTRVEHELREAQRDLDAAQAAGHVGSWVAEVAPKGYEARLRWSRETYRIFGMPAGLPVTVDEFFALVHPEDLERVRDLATESIQSGRTYEMEHRIVRADGMVRWVHEIATVERA